MKADKEKAHKRALQELSLRFDKAEELPHGHLFDFWVTQGLRQKGVILRYSTRIKPPSEIRIDIERFHKINEIGDFGLLALFGKLAFCADSHLVWALAHVHHYEHCTWSKDIYLKTVVTEGGLLRFRSPEGCRFCDGPLNRFSDIGIASMAKRSNHRVTDEA